MKRAFRVLALACLLFGIDSTRVAKAVEGPLTLPAPRWATPGQPPRPYRHLDFTQPSPYGVIVTYQSQKTGRTRQVFTYPGYRNGFPEPPFLYYGDPQVRWRPGMDMGAAHLVIEPRPRPDQPHRRPPATAKPRRRGR